MTTSDWQAHLVEDDEGIARILGEAKRIAVLGIKPESHASQAGHYVAAHMLAEGYDIIPVPTYYPEVTEILGRPVPAEARLLAGVAAVPQPLGQQIGRASCRERV